MVKKQGDYFVRPLNLLFSILIWVLVKKNGRLLCKEIKTPFQYLDLAKVFVLFFNIVAIFHLYSFMWHLFRLLLYLSIVHCFPSYHYILLCEHFIGHLPFSHSFTWRIGVWMEKRVGLMVLARNATLACMHAKFGLILNGNGRWRSKDLMGSVCVQNLNSCRLFYSFNPWHLNLIILEISFFNNFNPVVSYGWTSVKIGLTAHFNSGFHALKRGRVLFIYFYRNFW